MPLENVSEPDVQVDVVHVEPDAFESFFEDRVRRPGQLSVYRQVAVSHPFGSEFAAPVEPPDVVIEIVRGRLDADLGSGRISVADVSVVGVSAEAAPQQV